MSDINFNGENTDNVHIGDHFGDKIEEQNNVQGDQDKSQGTINGDVDTGGGDFTQMITSQGDISVDEAFEKLKKDVEGKEFPENTPEEMVEEFKSPVGLLTAAHSQASREINHFKPLELPETIEDQKKTWTDRFKAIGPLMGKTAISFTSGVIEKYMDGSPVLYGLSKALKTVHSEYK